MLTIRDHVATRMAFPPSKIPHRPSVLSGSFHVLRPQLPFFATSHSPFSVYRNHEHLTPIWLYIHRCASSNKRRHQDTEETYCCHGRATYLGRKRCQFQWMTTKVRIFIYRIPCHSHKGEGCPLSLNRFQRSFIVYIVVIFDWYV